MTLPICAHCSEPSTSKVRRGLCNKCYRNSEIRIRYPSKNAGGYIQPKFRHLEELRTDLPPGAVECVSCKTAVQVSPILYAVKILFRCPWSVCPNCKAGLPKLTMAEKLVRVKGK